MSDTAGYTDQVFGLFRLLGYQFRPRLADLSDARFWRTNPAGDYGPLNGIARHRVNTDLIANSRDDLLRVTGSLSTGAVRASEILRVLQGSGRPTPTGRAVAELGRIAKSLAGPDAGPAGAHRPGYSEQPHRPVGSCCAGRRKGEGDSGAALSTAARLQRSALHSHRGFGGVQGTRPPVPG